jgi:hypothetical protein
MPRDEHSIFSWGMPSYKDAKESFLGTTPALKVTDPENQKVKKSEPPKEKKVRPMKKKGDVVKNHILSLLTKTEE